MNKRSLNINVNQNKRECLMKRLEYITQINKVKRMIRNNLFRVLITNEKLISILKTQEVKINFMQKIIERNKKKG